MNSAHGGGGGPADKIQKKHATTTKQPRHPSDRRWANLLVLGGPSIDRAKQRTDCQECRRPRSIRPITAGDCGRSRDGHSPRRTQTETGTSRRHHGAPSHCVYLANCQRLTPVDERANTSTSNSPGASPKLGRPLCTATGTAASQPSTPRHYRPIRFERRWGCVGSASPMTARTPIATRMPHGRQVACVTNLV